MPDNVSAVAMVIKVGGHASAGGATGGGILPLKNFKSRGLEMLFPAFSKSYM